MARKEGNQRIVTRVKMKSLGKGLKGPFSMLSLNQRENEGKNRKHDGKTACVWGSGREGAFVCEKTPVSVEERTEICKEIRWKGDVCQNGRCFVKEHSVYTSGQIRQKRPASAQRAKIVMCGHSLGEISLLPPENTCHFSFAVTESPLCTCSPKWKNPFILWETKQNENKYISIKSCFLSTLLKYSCKLMCLMSIY